MNRNDTSLRRQMNTIARQIDRLLERRNDLRARGEWQEVLDSVDPEIVRLSGERAEVQRLWLAALGIK